MHEPRSALVHAFRRLLGARGLAHPTGEPLYSYRLTHEEFEEVERVLKATAPDFLYDTHGRALFVLFTSEWFRRVREGGHWDWIHPLGALNVRYNSNGPSDARYPEVKEAAKAGLASWRRPHRTGSSILHAVIAECGFPAAAVRQGPRLADWLRRSILTAEAGFGTEQAVASEAWRAPETLVQTLFDAAVALCQSVVSLRASASSLGSDGDPVARLDRIRPSWRAELPFDLEDQDVRKLVEDLVRAKSQENVKLDVMRRLRLIDGTWQAFAELPLNGEIDHRRLPPALVFAIGDAERVRIRPGGELSEQGRFVAVLERIRDEASDRWELRPLVQRCDLRLNLEHEFRLQAISADRLLAEFTAFSGDPLLGPAVALELPEGAQPGQVTELQLLGPSSARTTSSFLALAIEKDIVQNLKVVGETYDLGVLEGSERLVIAFEGQAELQTADERLVWSTRAERREAPRITLVGNTIRGIGERVFLGAPDLWIADDDAAIVTPHRDVVWRPIGRAEWRSRSQGDPVGAVELSVRRKGLAVGSVRADIVPPDFRVDADAKTRSLKVTGMGGGSVAATSSGKALSCQRISSESTVIDIAEHERGTALNIRLLWSSALAISLPDPISDPVLLDPLGKQNLRPRLSVAKLAGYRLLAPTPRALVLELRQHGARPAYVSRLVDGTLPLMAISDLVLQLLGGCEQLDAFVRLSWSDRAGTVVEIGWYDFDQPLTTPSEGFRNSALAQLRASPILVAVSLVYPEGGVVSPPAGTEADMRLWLNQELGEGPWLLAGQLKDGRRLRPKVLDDTDATQTPAGLRSAASISSALDRDAALDELLSAPGELPSDDLRYLISLARVSSMAELPYSSVDALRALARNSSAAIYALAECNTFEERHCILRLQTELPTLWCAGAIEDWIAAFSAKRSRMAANLMQIGESARLADVGILRGLTEVLDLEPALRLHVQTVVFLSVAATEDKVQITDRLAKLTRGDLPSLIQTLVRRHGDGMQVPPSLGLHQLVSEFAGLWGRFDTSFADLIAAPVVVAKMAMKELPRDPHLAACRSAWLFDRDYFETAVTEILFDRARS